MKSSFNVSECIITYLSHRIQSSISANLLPLRQERGTKAMDKSTIKHIYRITHLDNIPHILKYGIESPHSCNNTSEYIAIGDKSLIECRNNYKVTVNGKSITLGDFIPFYFGYRMPMLYSIQHGYNNVPKAVLPDEIIYLACHISDFVNKKFLFYFSDGHGTNRLSKFDGIDSINDINKIVDTTAVWSAIWSGETIDRDLKRRKQAEFIVGQNIPPDMIRYFGCYNEQVKQKLLSFDIKEEQIFVTPEAYY